MRAILCVLDSFGVGAADSAAPADQGANTFGHIAIAAANGQADRDGLRAGPLKIPNLLKLGLGRTANQSGHIDLPLADPGEVAGRHGYAAERSYGKDTPSGHWEMSGLPVEYEWGYFPLTNSFPPELLDAFIEKAGLPGVLGNKHASGTEVIKELGEEHIRTGKPIVYTSADSVFQIAAHEAHFGLERLYEISKIARTLADPFNIGRIIARPFAGETPETFKRTGNRKDIAVPPHGPTLLDRVKDAGHEVIAIGKVGDIFAYQGVTQTRKASDNPSVYRELTTALETAPDQSLIFANFNDFDTLFGHRRDVAGYAACLETFDQWLPSIQAAMKPGDVMVITADHGCDPTWEGSDHTREYTPVLAFGPGVEPADIGRRETFADIGQSLASHLHLKPLDFGASFL
jgi:phosphopentomutase